MTKILGLDLGTNSIGWAVVNRGKENTSLLNKGVHIFSEGVQIEKGIESSKAAERTKFRSARRIKFRRKLRKIKTLEVLINNNMCPLSIEELKKWRKNKKAYPNNPEFIEWLKTDDARNINPYHFRDKASKGKVPLIDLGRALYHLAQRRGFLSGRLDQSNDGAIEHVRQEYLNQIDIEDNSEELIASLNVLSGNYAEEDDKAVKKLLKSIAKIILENKFKPFEEFKESLLKLLNKTENLGAVKKDIADLSKEIADANCETLGQYFYKLYSKKEKIRIRYTSREEHYLFEFNKICYVQQLTKEIREELLKAIFYQRPLKSQKGLVGKCSFEKNKPRCPVSHPAFEEYRALQFINSIKIGTTEFGEKEFLSEEQRKQIWSKFIRKSKPNFEFEDIAKDLTPKNEHRYFNYKNYVSVSGCPTIAGLVNIFGEGWKQNIFNSYPQDLKNKRKRIKIGKGKYKKSDEIIGQKNVDEIIDDIWHILFQYDKKEKLQEFAKNKLGLNEVKAKKFSGIILKKDYASLSLKAINKILPYLHQGLIYSYAVFLANIENAVGKEAWDKPENQELIKKELKLLIDNYNEIKKREGIVNDLMTQFKERYNNADKNYVLDEKDKKDVKEKTIATYGSKTFSKLDATQQQEIFVWIEEKYLTQLRKYRGEFIKSQRLDEKIASFLSDNFNATAKALEQLYHPSDIELFKTPKRAEDGNLYLGSPITGSIKNPMAMRAMHQLRKLVNTLIREGKIDEETKIHIELARELNDANKRAAIRRWQEERKKQREEYRLDIIKLYKEQSGQDIEPTEDEILKFQLWQEQNDACLYTGNKIGICDFIGGNPMYDIEHTIPKSLSYDNSQENLTLCENKFNREIKKNRIPFELANHKDILLRLAKWEENVKDFEYKYNSRKKAKGIETKEQKDKRIKDKHYFKLHLDYWKGKLNRFTREDVPIGFKNSQLVDTGIITKYSRAFLKSIFPQVYSVKGDAVAEFRKLWGLQTEYSKKERTNHIHHCIDAITIACMTKDKYDMLAKLYHADEENRTSEVKEVLRNLKPWPTFKEDVDAIVNEVMVSHHTPDNMKKQSKKKLRVRGKIQKDSTNKPIFQTGDTVRASLHKETFYGAIKNNKKDGAIEYVIRKDITSIKRSDIDKIVDDVVKEKIKKAIDDKILIITSNDQQANKIIEKIWMNKEKGIEIKKVRVFTPSISNPIHLKTQKDKSKFEHKQHYYVANDENYCLAIYEGVDKKGKIKRDCEIVNTIEAGEYFRLSSKSHREQYPITQEKMNGLNFKTIIRKGQMVLLYDKTPEEIWQLSDEVRLQRMYKITQLDTEKSAEIKLLYHQEAREKKILTKHMGLKTGMKGGKNIGKFKEFPWIKLGVNSFDALLEGLDFRITTSGEIKEINK
jgi:CRISPR-associated endonuclease Csn1